MSSSNKRPAENSLATPASKKAKVHPLFSQTPAVEKYMGFQWIKGVGARKTCLHGMHLTPKAHARVAFFDLDGTIIKPTFGKGDIGPKEPEKWQWWKPAVKASLIEAAKDHAIVFVSNQGGTDASVQDFQKKLPLIAQAIPQSAFWVFAATGKDIYRKPLPGMYNVVEEIFSEAGVQIYKSISFMVGDAAGRKGDFSSSDRKWAENVGLKFYTPEEYFLKKATQTYELPGFRAASWPFVNTLAEPKPIRVSPTPEIVLFSGLPCLGKTTFYNRTFAPAGYVHVNQDVLGSRPKCLKAVQEALADGKSCVVDNTNKDAKTRKFYIDVAEKLEVSIRCIAFTGSLELANHNNVYRALIKAPVEGEVPRALLPALAFNTFNKGYEEPHVDEGFSAVHKVDWKFEGTAEERKKWNMWLQVSGK